LIENPIFPLGVIADSLVFAAMVEIPCASSASVLKMIRNGVWRARSTNK